MRIELLYFNGRPSYAAHLPRIETLHREAALDQRIELRRVESDHEAQAAQLLGSPTPPDESVRAAPRPGK